MIEDTKNKNIMRKNEYYISILLRYLTELIPLIIFVIISFILANRELYTSPDDDNYIMYFSNQVIPVVTSAWYFIIEEPLWLIYSSFMGEMFGPEPALRFTIFVSTLLFLVACNKLSKGAWKFTLMVFILDYSLATLFYYIQIRNGFALSIFLVTVALGLSPVFAAIIASSIHSSFLLVIPFTLIAYLTKKSKIYLGVLLVVIIFSSFYLKNIIELIDLGRRSAAYQLEKTTNIIFYLYALIQYSLLILVYKKTDNDKQLSYLINFSLLLFVSTMCLTLVHEAAIRLLFVSNTIVFIVLGRNIKSNRGIIGCTAYIVLLFLLIVKDFIVGNLGPDSWFIRWAAILS